MQAHIGTAAVMICELLVAIHVVAEFVVSPGTKIVSTLKKPD